MPGISFKVVGRLFTGDERRALLLTRAGRPYTLRLGLVLQGEEELLLPESLLDDWGHEIRGIELYQWVRENALHFPRAELFGFDRGGRPQQRFIRELDVTVKHPCFIYENSNVAFERGVQVTDILLPRQITERQKQRQTPADVAFPLSQSDVQWWLVEDRLARRPDYDFFDQSDEEGSE